MTINNLNLKGKKSIKHQIEEKRIRKSEWQI